MFNNSGPCSAYYGEKPARTVPQILPDPLTYAPCGYKPAQLRSAYGTDLTLKGGYDGRGTTVAVVDAYASPTILADTQKYASRNDPQHPFRSYQFAQSLPTTYSFTSDECDAAGWYGEETLDVQAVHAMAPAANILYVGGSSCQRSGPDRRGEHRGGQPAGPGDHQLLRQHRIRHRSPTSTGSHQSLLQAAARASA